MTSNPRSREAAYADLVAGLIDARVDVASERFDAELESAEASGRLDPATARLLRWWQRESVREVTEHARTTIPGTLVALERAAAEAREAVHRADAAWTTARGVTARTGYPDVAPAPPPSPATAPWSDPTWTEPAWTESSTGHGPTDPARTAPTENDPVWAQQPATTQPAPPIPHAPVTPEPPTRPGGPAAAATSWTTEPIPAPGEAPQVVDLTDQPPRPDPGHDAGHDTSETPGEGPRRTLLAGLTVLPRND